MALSRDAIDKHNQSSTRKLHTLGLDSLAINIISTQNLFIEEPVIIDWLLYVHADSFPVSMTISQRSRSLERTFFCDKSLDSTFSLFEKASKSYCKSNRFSFSIGCDKSDSPCVLHVSSLSKTHFKKSFDTTIVVINIKFFVE